MLLNNFTFLYVEDNHDMQNYMNVLIADEVKDFYQAYDGEEAISLYKDKNPDIILSDINMPKMNGLEMSRVIKKLDNHQPIFLLSAFEDISILKQAINIGINGFISKPIDDIKSLLAMLEDQAFHLQNERDAKNLRLKEKKAQEKIRLAASVFTNSQEGILISDKNNCIIDVNSAALDITGYTREEVIGNTPSLFSSGTQSSHFYSEIWQALECSGHWQGEICNRKKSGEIYSERLSINTVLDEKGVLQHYVAVFYDITQLKIYEKKLKHIAYNDALTALPNRLLLYDRMQQALYKAKRNKRILAICYLDLDGFKAVNDTYGHKAGDDILVEAAKRLMDSIRADDTVARLGGDEFVLLMSDITNSNELKLAVQRVLAIISRPYPLANDLVSEIDSISASIGVTLYPQDEGDIDTLLLHADQAMYKAKKNGRNQYSFFDKTILIDKHYE